MRIERPHSAPVPATSAAGPGRRAAETAPAFEAAPAPAPASPAPTDDEASAAGKAHGLVRAAEHSNRSDVAALRQWINHPELRADLALPELTGEHKGKGFERAVAAYEAAVAVATPPPVTEAPPATEEPPAPEAPPAEGV